MDALGPLEGKHHFELEPSGSVETEISSPHIYSVATSAKQAGAVAELLGSRAKPAACL